MEAGTGFPGYNSLMPKSAGTFAEVLKQNGWNTSWFGKNHNVPDWQSSQAGPFDLWPTGLGFEYFYGFIGGDTNQWQPAIFEGTKPIEPPHDAKDYFFEKGMADHAIAGSACSTPWRRKNRFWPITRLVRRAPHHAPKDWIAKFKGKFDQGWDKERENIFARQKARDRPGRHEVDGARSRHSPMGQLSADQKKVFAHMMEVYAAALRTVMNRWAHPQCHRSGG